MIQCNYIILLGGNWMLLRDKRAKNLIIIILLGLLILAKDHKVSADSKSLATKTKEQIQFLI